jgi:hypothetical protein
MLIDLSIELFLKVTFHKYYGENCLKLDMLKLTGLDSQYGLNDEEYERFKKPNCPLEFDLLTEHGGPL